MDFENSRPSHDTTAARANRGFDLFMVEVALLLPLATVMKLAVMFNFSPADTDEVERSPNPKYAFVTSLREKGIINPTDISSLLDALKAIDRLGVSNDVEECFRKNVPNSRSPSDLSTRLSARVESFLQEIKLKYRYLCNAVKPIPYDTDGLMCVDKVFIDSGIEFLTQGLWKRLDSYHCILSDPRLASNRYIMLGEPGFGKSTFALQLAFDWYSRSPASPLKDIDILIFLPLREARGFKSIFSAIQSFLLPQECQFSPEDIRDILCSSKSVAFVFDGFNEYLQMPDNDDDISHIISGRMFNNFLVILTTRPSCKPFKLTPTTVHLRLPGFNPAAQYKYTCKVFGYDTNATEGIRSLFERNPALRDLCQVPLFFVLFSHLTHEKKGTKGFASVTKLFRYIIACFHEHMKNKVRDSKMAPTDESKEGDHHKLDKVAFKSCRRKKKSVEWVKDEFRDMIGFDLYKQYNDAGILIEEEKIIIKDEPGTPNLIQRKEQVRFFHEVFRDWYAANYLSSCAEKRIQFKFQNLLKTLDPLESQYVFRFVCGINPNAAPTIIKYLRNVEGGDKFAILCILEQTGDTDNIKNSIQQLCSKGVLISGHDSLVLQRSSMQLLEIAAEHAIPIEYVELYNCIHCVESSDQTKAVIQTISGLALSSQIPAKRLRVSFFDRGLTENEAISILDFCSKCPSLLVTWFNGSVPPQSFKVGPILSRLKSNDVTVKYSGVFVESCKYILNLTTGRWEREESREECTDEDFQKMRSDWDEVKDVTDETHRGNVKKARESLREGAGSTRDEVKQGDAKLFTKAQQL